MTSDSQRATRLLQRLQSGDTSASEELLPLLYAELRKIAAREMDGEPRDHTLQPTGLVHEAWIRLSGSPPDEPWRGRAHFVRVAAGAMRRVLVDHARKRRAQKRGGDSRRDPLDQPLRPPRGGGASPKRTATTGSSSNRRPSPQIRRRRFDPPSLAGDRQVEVFHRTADAESVGRKNVARRNHGTMTAGLRLARRVREPGRAPHRNGPRQR